MRSDILINLVGLLWIASMRVSAKEVDGCPKDELACHDIMNGSQCIEQLVIEKQSELTKEAMVKCVEHEGTASTLPGATKVRGLNYIMI